MSDSVKTLLIAIGLLVLISTAWFFLLYNPKVSKISEIKQQTQKLIDRIRSFRVTQDHVDDLETQIAAISKEIAANEARVISKDELPGIVRQIHKTGRKYGVDFKKIIPDYDSLIEIGRNSNDEIYELVMHIQLRATYKQFGLFLEALDKMPFMVSLGEMTMAYSPESFPRLAIEVGMILYLDEKTVSES